MKKILLIVLMLPLAALGQNLQTGIKFGYSTSRLINTKHDTSRAKAGLTFGVTETYNLSERLSINSGILFLYNGFTISDTVHYYEYDVYSSARGTTIGERKSVYNLSSIQVPLTMRYIFGNKNEVPFLELGGYCTAPISASGRLFTPITGGNEISKRFSVSKPGYDLGLSLGAGVSFRMNKSILLAQASIMQGLRKQVVNNQTFGNIQSLVFSANVLF